MLLLKAQKYLEVVRKRGEAGKDLEKVYRMVCCKELYLLAYQNLYANNGALTPGIVPDDTVDGHVVRQDRNHCRDAQDTAVSVETITKDVHRQTRWEEQTSLGDARMDRQTGPRGDTNGVGGIL